MYAGIWHVDQLTDLVADRLHDAHERAMAQKVTAPPGKEVQIPVTLGTSQIHDPSPLTRLTG